MPGLTHHSTHEASTLLIASSPQQSKPKHLTSSNSPSFGNAEVPIASSMERKILYRCLRMMGLPCLGGATGNREGLGVMGGLVGQPSHFIETLWCKKMKVACAPKKASPSCPNIYYHFYNSTKVSQKPLQLHFVLLLTRLLAPRNSEAGQIRCPAWGHKQLAMLTNPLIL